MTKKKRMDGKMSGSKTLVKKEYTPEDKERIANYRKQSEERLAKFTCESDSPYQHFINHKGKDEMLALAKLAEALGTTDGGLQHYFITQVINTFKMSSSSKDVDNQLADYVNHSLAILQGIKPQDEVESMLVLQMIGVHNLAMVAMNQARTPGQTFIGQQGYINQATKLLRTYTAQVEALKKYRTGGQQKVTVEHVNVNEGGQAIVGNVTTPGGRGNNNEKDE